MPDARFFCVSRRLDKDSAGAALRLTCEIQ
jgi:hypothetical protein